MASRDDDISFEQIRNRAYELWERNHQPEGFEIEFWLAAERELRTVMPPHRQTGSASDGSSDGDHGTTFSQARNDRPAGYVMRTTAQMRATLHPLAAAVGLALAAPCCIQGWMRQAEEASSPR